MTKDSDNEKGNLGCIWFIRNNTYKATRSGNPCKALVKSAYRTKLQSDPDQSVAGHDDHKVH